MFLGFLAAGGDPLALWLAASLGNSLGSVCNWLLGRYLLHFENRPWFPVSRARLGRSQHWFQRYGRWSLLFAWLPVGGDGLTFIAGVMRVPFVQFFVLTALGKSARYAFLLGIALGMGAV
ncbi:MAG: YqaA family protein [Pseudomonadota bacterium]